MSNFICGWTDHCHVDGIGSLVILLRTYQIMVDPTVAASFSLRLGAALTHVDATFEKPLEEKSLRWGC
jgi:hypothetical protein